MRNKTNLNNKLLSTVNGLNLSRIHHLRGVLLWLPLRLSKHQSPLLTTVLLRTTLTRTIKLHYYSNNTLVWQLCSFCLNFSDNNILLIFLEIFLRYCNKEQGRGRHWGYGRIRKESWSLHQNYGKTSMAQVTW